MSQTTRLDGHFVFVTTDAPDRFPDCLRETMSERVRHKL